MIMTRPFPTAGLSRPERHCERGPAARFRPDQRQGLLPDAEEGEELLRLLEGVVQPGQRGGGSTQGTRDKTPWLGVGPRPIRLLGRSPGGQFEI